MATAAPSRPATTGCAASAVNDQTQPRQSAPAASAPAQTPAETTRQLTAEEAQAIALQHAGFTADQVRFLRTEPELRDRVPHYDVEFKANGLEYDYDIDATTGEVFNYSSEADD